jgi:hypothetical protein
MCSLSKLLWAMAIASICAWGVVAPAYADDFGVVTGLVNGKMGIAPLDAQGQRNVAEVAECDVAEVQKALGRTPEVGDELQYVDKGSNKCKLQGRSVKTDVWPRVLTILLCAAFVIGAASLAARGSPLKFLIGADGRYSNSQVQLALWFGVAMTMYLTTTALRVSYLGWDYLGGVAMTANVIALTGLSALTFGAAKVITAQKVETAANAAANVAAVTAANAAAPAAQVIAAATTAATVAATGSKENATGEHNILTDLFQNDKKEVDIGDFQMIFVAFSAMAIFALSCFNSLETLPHLVHVSLPDVDTSLLAGFGIGQGAYLVKKAALPLGKG